jgi:hypothetical protein
MLPVLLLGTRWLGLYGATLLDTHEEESVRATPWLPFARSDAALALLETQEEFVRSVIVACTRPVL